MPKLIVTLARLLNCISSDCRGENIITAAIWVPGIDQTTNFCSGLFNFYLIFIVIREVQVLFETHVLATRPFAYKETTSHYSLPLLGACHHGILLSKIDWSSHDLRRATPSRLCPRRQAS